MQLKISKDMLNQNFNLMVVAVDFFPKVGGISTMVHHLCNALVDIGANVIVIAPSGSYIPDEFDAKYHLVVDSDSNITQRNGSEATKQDRRIINFFCDQHKIYSFDRVLLMHPFYYGLPAVKFSRKNKLPISSMFYGYELNALLVEKHSHFRSLLSRIMGPRSVKERAFEVIKESDEILAISNFTKKLVEKVKGHGLIRVTGCGISQNDFDREIQISPRYDQVIRKKVRHKLKIHDPNRQMVLFVGRLVASKHVDLIITALQYLPEVSLVVVGEGPELPKLKSLAEKMGVYPQVNWVGKVSENIKWQYMRAADVFILSSTEMPTGQVEGFGIVLLEASAAGAPVIASRSGGMVDVVDNDSNGLLCDPYDPRDLAEKIDYILANEDMAAKYVEGAREKIKTRFNWKTIALNMTESWVAL